MKRGFAYLVLVIFLITIPTVWSEDCAKDGSDCLNDSACCSGWCSIRYRKCQTCVNDGYLCKHHAMCCSKFCPYYPDAKCQKCLDAGSKCTSHQECCSRFCTDELKCDKVRIFS